MLLGLSLLLALQSCEPFGVRAKGELITLDFDETDFHGFDLSLSADVEVLVGPEYKVSVTCEENVMPYVETHVSNGVLRIDFSRNVYDLDQMKIVVTAPEWNQFEVSGSGDMEVLDSIEGDLLKMEVSGSGGIDVRSAFFNKADLKVSGSGDLDLAGTATELKCRVSGSGNLDCFEFPVNIAHVSVSGSGNARVHVLEQLDAEVSGSGDVIYKGNPQVSAQISGSGSVRKQ